MEWSKLISIKRKSDEKIEIKTDLERNRFEQDFDRIIFSQPFRNLQDKTQVFPMPDDAFVHTRLTHSLEVSSVGRTLGKNAGVFLLNKYPDLKERWTPTIFGHIVASACLAHDMGNPPFGHSGEKGISTFFVENESLFKNKVSQEEWEDLINFEGNAQGFRILNQNAHHMGLELTYTTLSAMVKYPCSASISKNKNRKSQQKYGFFCHDLENYHDIATQLGILTLAENTWCRHPLAFLVEAADDICYSIIDMEDACRIGIVSFEAFSHLLIPLIGDHFKHSKLQSYPTKSQKIGVLRALAISSLIHNVTEVFQKEETSLLNGTFDKALVDEIPNAHQLKNINVFSKKEIYQSKRVTEKEVGGYEIINHLMNAFSTVVVNAHKNRTTSRDLAMLRLMPEATQKIIESHSVSFYEGVRTIIDFISSLTDRYAVKLYKIVRGI